MSKTKTTTTKVKVTAKAEPSAQSPTAYQTLRHINKWLAIAYTLQALVLLVLATGKTFPVLISFLGVDSLAAQSAGATVYTAASKHLFDMPLAQLLGLTLGISAAFHALQAFFIRPMYEEMLSKQQNPYRWMENAFSASLLPIAIGLTVGVRDVITLIILFVLGFITHLLGWQFEHHMADKQTADAQRSFSLLTIAGLATWLSIGVYALASVIFGNGLPLFAGIAYGIALAGVLGFGWMLLLRKQGRRRWQDYAFVEKSAIILSFVIKSAVAWLLLAAVR